MHALDKGVQVLLEQGLGAIERCSIPQPLGQLHQGLHVMVCALHNMVFNRTPMLLDVTDNTRQSHTR